MLGQHTFRREVKFYQANEHGSPIRYGNPLVPVQGRLVPPFIVFDIHIRFMSLGVGYVNELVARLTDSAVANVTNVNRTLDADPLTFPLGCSIYADFSHDNQMGRIYTALGLHKPSFDLPTDRIIQSSWVTSQLLSFAAQLVVEKYTCDPSYARGASTQWIRILNNDRVIEVPQCVVRGEGGLCGLAAFIHTLYYAMSGAADDWAKCQSTNASVID
jgi:hypothetical protein